MMRRLTADEVSVEYKAAPVQNRGLILNPLKNKKLS